MRSVGTASAAAPGTMGTLVRHHHDQVCPQHSHLYTSSHAVHIAAVSCMAIRSLRGGSSPAPGTGGYYPPASLRAASQQLLQPHRASERASLPLGFVRAHPSGCSPALERLRQAAREELRSNAPSINGPLL